MTGFCNFTGFFPLFLDADFLLVDVEPALNSSVLEPGDGTSVNVACGDGASPLIVFPVGAGSWVLVPALERRLVATAARGAQGQILIKVCCHIRWIMRATYLGWNNGEGRWALWVESYCWIKIR